MRWLGMGLVFLSCQASWACRLVCSNDTEMMHLLADGETDQFQAVSNSQVLSRGLDCQLLAPAGDEQAKEEQRMMNLCTVPSEEAGVTIQLRTELVRKRGVARGERGPVEKQQDLVIWTWEALTAKAKHGEPVAKVLRTAVFPRGECGSSEER